MVASNEKEHRKMKVHLKSAMLSFAFLVSNTSFAVNNPLVGCEGDLMVIKRWQMISGCRQQPTPFVAAMILSRQQNVSIGKAEISIGTGLPDGWPVPDHLCDNPRGYYAIVVVDKVKLPKGSWDIHFSESKSARVQFTDAHDGAGCTVDEN